jgi:ABC-type branched-subunit amino acid transport system ATPase component
MTAALQAVLSAAHLGVRYGGVEAVRGVDLDVHAGRIHGLIGPNGAGKSSLIDALTGFQASASGTVHLDGRDITGLAPHARARLGLSRSFQHLELFDDLTVRENLVVAARASRRGDRDGVGSAAALLGIEDIMAARISDLAHGKRRLVTVARALCARPSVLVLDEPATGLDMAETDHLGGCLRTIAGSGTGVLLVDHDMSLVLSVSSTVTVLDFGAVLAAGTPEAIRGDATVRKAYLG